MIKKTLFILWTLFFLVQPLYAGKIEDSLTIVNNPLNSVDDRRKAVEEIKTSRDPRVLPALIEIIRNSAEPTALRSHIVDQLMQSNDEWCAIELKKIALDTALPSEVRKPALYGLWIKNPEEFKSEVINIAQNSAEPIDLRVTALTYLRTSVLELPLSFWKILIGKNNNAQIRIAALNGMEQHGFLRQEKTSLVQIIQDPNEDIQLRKTAVLNAERFFPPEAVIPELIQIISTASNSLEMRKFALDHLASYPVRNSISQLEKILAMEKNPSFKNDLKLFLETATTQN